MKKKSEQPGTWSRLLHYCRSHIPVILIAVISAAAGTILTLLGPDQLSELTDLIIAGIVTGIDLDAVASIGLFLIFIYALSAVLSLGQGLIMSMITQKVSRSLRSDLSRKMNRLPIPYYNKSATGDILSRVTNDVDTIGQALNQSVGTLVTAIALFAGSMIMMFKTNVIMTLTGIAATLIGFGLMSVIMKKSQKYFQSQQEFLGKINGHVEEVYTGHTVVKAYNGEAQMRETFDSLNQSLKQSAFKAQFLSGLMMPLMTFIGNLGYVAVCVVGAVLAINGSISFGVIVAFIMYVRFFTQPLAQMAQAAQNLQAASAASRRVFEFLDAEEMDNEDHKQTRLVTAEGHVTFEHVQFAYEETDNLVIKDFSTEVQPGQKIAIVGPTGAGKTTLINLLIRFNELTGGEIYIDGSPISSLTRENIHDLFCMVLQDTWMFEGTVRENLVYNKTGVTDAEIEAACRSVGLHPFIQTLSHGYDTVLSDKVNLSAGQKQQLTIARAMLKNAPMLILDEATSSVDTRTELLIQQAMDQLMEGRTSFVIAHRLSTIKNADVILVLKDGDILESGSHSELLAKNGFYAELYNSQFEQAS
ncbi:MULTISPECIES: ABC transporter ATP-binding protein [unclassified Paenibacillus]|uniref:ABC transporter ATP-binding protein n=1 Tax=unclassified Paenibacillus TaxID=185978 RepID=UPI0024066221|nr:MULTISPECIES: ABC transporter ATP-binding protein [unclassified Paenibacillus]MDF9839352.1 ATP-binding cassette subfamily B multidrug efflux pump [Paenibacillus sp. PastF-2]MDF9845933.1 ATP-binding cassette subfamily B multidrug efflux pump [Paenibacillus sp. PastM-2]MDF9852506.1 ATP-binding cassette subfamily B multidrug efflux pump [Paenibacillus sp. PastF-1]MDH6477764.1 ATP-binding cassette subfamily B multidrug efflux pump [Paenibacillus sp. PastH-2]MDH6505503.1 ATP-binding cassette sub